MKNIVEQNGTIRARVSLSVFKDPDITLEKIIKDEAHRKGKQVDSGILSTPLNIVNSLKESQDIIQSFFMIKNNKENPFRLLCNDYSYIGSILYSNPIDNIENETRFVSEYEFRHISLIAMKSKANEIANVLSKHEEESLQFVSYINEIVNYDIDIIPVEDELFHMLLKSSSPCFATLDFNAFDRIEGNGMFRLSELHMQRIQSLINICIPKTLSELASTIGLALGNGYDVGAKRLLSGNDVWKIYCDRSSLTRHLLKDCGFPPLEAWHLLNILCCGRTNENTEIILRLHGFSEDLLNDLKLFKFIPRRSYCIDIARLLINYAK